MKKLRETIRQKLSPKKSTSTKKQEETPFEENQELQTQATSSSKLYVLPPTLQVASSSLSPITTSTPQISSKTVKQHKPYLYSFLENLFKINMSHDALVDIIINDDPLNNQTIIVGRPKVLGSATKQMRHVTPYSFIEQAIKAVINETESNDLHDNLYGYKPYIDKIVDSIKPLIQSKKGICLTSEQYQKLLPSTGFQSEVSGLFKFKTLTQAQQQNEYYLIHNETLIEQFNQSNNFLEKEKVKAYQDFSSKFAKYINCGVQYLIDEILDPADLNSVTIVCEGLARIILTMFNQDKYAAFPQEGNSLLEEIRLYNDPRYCTSC